MRTFLRCGLLVGLILSAIAGCSKDEPVKLGFLGTLSGRGSDLGADGLNGAQLAIEIANSNGGLRGKPIALLIKDDSGHSIAARRAAEELIDADVSAIIGPMTSSIALEVVPYANKARTVMVSPTVTAKRLAELDDYFFRLLSSTTEYATRSAIYHHEIGEIKRISAIFDIRNHAYSSSWLDDFRQVFEAHGGKLTAEIAFEAGGPESLAQVVDLALKGHPDSVLLITASLDAALLTQEIRRQSKTVSIITSEWAATEQLAKVGGSAAEGIVSAQFMERNSQAPDFVNFKIDYQKRFGHEPGYAATTAFDATNIVIQAIKQAKPGVDLKQAILAEGKYSGIQAPITFNKTGDAQRKTTFTVIENGKFRVLE